MHHSGGRPGDPDTLLAQARRPSAGMCSRDVRNWHPQNKGSSGASRIIKGAVSDPQTEDRNVLDGAAVRAQDLQKTRQRFLHFSQLLIQLSTILHDRRPAILLQANRTEKRSTFPGHEISAVRRRTLFFKSRPRAASLNSFPSASSR